MKGARVLSIEDVESLLKVARDQRERCLVLIGLYLGTRISETVSLNFGDFKGSYIRISSVKNSNDKVRWITPELRKEIENLKIYYSQKGWEIDPETPLFSGQKKVGKKAGRLARESACRLFKQIKERADLCGRVTSHSLIKSFATKIYELSGENFSETIACTGHKKADSVFSYVPLDRCSAENKRLNLTSQVCWI